MSRVCRLLAFLVPLLAFAAGAAPAVADDQQLLARLSDEQRKLYVEWKQARASFDRIHDAYWSAVNASRAERRRKYAGRLSPSPADYVMQQPPKYSGPALRSDIAKLMADLVPSVPPTEIVTLPEMLVAARQHYRFTPSLVPEREFKRRYAYEALATGLTMDEVTRIYAFETGGRGTFDMQAGINPETKQGRAISTAMGYAQLLAANSVGELAQYGDGFVSRLSMLAVRRDTPPERVRELTAKIESVQAMLRVARSVPREWSRHTALARSAPGYGIHVLNLDGDIGPWLQVIKLRGIKDTAAQAGRPNLSPAELELMNLAGPRTGLEMMEPVGRTAPTANFFSEAAYYRNTIVREKTAAELLAAIDERMNENMKRPGSQEFVAVFEEVGARGRQVSQEQRQQLMPATAMRIEPPLPVAAVAVRSETSSPVPTGLIPPAPMRAMPPLPAREAEVRVPAPIPAEHPTPALPAARMQWAPVGMPLGFPQ